MATTAHRPRQAPTPPTPPAVPDRDVIGAIATIQRKAMFLSGLLESDMELTDDGDRRELAAIAIAISNEAHALRLHLSPGYAAWVKGDDDSAVPPDEKGGE